MIIACIGSRDLKLEQLEICRKLGRWIAQKGGAVRTGNAPGADQAFAEGANQVDPGLVYLCLPWAGFNAEAIRLGNSINTPDYDDFRIAQDAHPAWDKLSSAGKKLHARNVQIVLGSNDYEAADLVVAWPSKKAGGGGTGQGMRVAEKSSIPVEDISGYSVDGLRSLCARIAKLAK